jgi:nucleotide-binding universal stress UspA family protein
LINTVIDGSGEHAPGAIRDFPDVEANRLIMLRAAEPLTSAVPSSSPSEEADSSGEEEYSEEELREMAEKLKEIDGVNEEIAYRLIEAGFRDIQSIAEANSNDLIVIKGIGKRNVGKIQESAEDIWSKPTNNIDK